MIKKLKLEIFYLRKVFLIYKFNKTLLYIKNKYFLASKILKLNKVLEKPVNHPDLSIHLLTCHKDLVMLIWSLASFYKVSKIVGQLFIHDDGSLTQKDKSIINKFFPSAKIIDSSNFVKDFSTKLDEFPIIKKFRKDYPQYVLLKKIIDPYFVSNKSNLLIIDSDLLWFKNPGEVESEISDGCNNSLMMSTDVACPVYFKEGRLDENLAKLNSGIVLYKKDNFRLEKFSSYLNFLDISNKENSHFIEQAGYAYSLNNIKPLSQSKYIAKGKVNDNVIMRHYTSPRRPLLYIEGLEILKKDYV